MFYIGILAKFLVHKDLYYSVLPKQNPIGNQIRRDAQGTVPAHI